MDVPAGAPTDISGFEDQITNHTIVERDLPDKGTGDWGNWYESLKGTTGTIIIDNEAGVFGSNTAIAQIRFSTQKQSIVVEDLTGCIAVIGISHLGKFNQAQYLCLYSLTAFRAHSLIALHCGETI